MVTVFTFSSHTPLPGPSFVVFVGKEGNIIITENIVGLWKPAGGGASMKEAPPHTHILLFFFFLGLILFFPFRLEREPFAVTLSQLK